MNYKLLLGLTLLLVVILPYLPAVAQTGGIIPSKITWEPETDQGSAILRVASGESNLFYWTVRLTMIPEEVRRNLTLIFTYSTYNVLVFNIAQNVVDPRLSGNVTYRPPDRVIPGQYIPGLILVDPDVWIPKSARLGFHVNITELNVTMYRDLVWNPLAIREIRFALNYLIDRIHIVSAIYGGSALPKYCAILVAHPQYPTMFKPICEDKYGFRYDPEYAKEIFINAISQVNGTLRNYAMSLFFGTDGWLYFKKPDGSTMPVFLNFMIRVEDERLEIGRYAASEIEEWFKIKVNRIEKPRPRPVHTVIYNNPVKRDRFGTIPVGTEYEPRIWHIYTEGWITTVEEPWHWLRWTITFFYLPYSGYGPNNWYLGWRWYGNVTLYDLQLKLNYGVYTVEAPLRTDILKGLEYGIWESIRVFLVDEITAYPAHAGTLVDFVAGYAGLSNPWAIRSLRWSVTNVKYLQFSATGALFMSWWNPLTGFTDIYSENMHRHLADYDYWVNPVTGLHVPMRVEKYKVEQTSPAAINVSSITGYVYDPVEDKWVHVSNGTVGWLNATYTRLWGKSLTKIIDGTLKICSYVETRYKSKDGRTLGKWHDGSDYTIADLLYGIAFSFEWSFNDKEITGEADPFYWDEFAPPYGLYRYFGFKIINWTTMAYWYDYADVLPVYVADAADVFADMPWHLLYAGEEIIVNHGEYIHDPTGTRYGWSTITLAEVDYQAVDYIEPETTNDIKTALTKLKGDTGLLPKIPEYFTTYPEADWVGNLTLDVDDRYSKAIAFIDTYGHSYVSQGPYYVKSYNPTTFRMEIERYPHYQFPEIFDYILGFKGQFTYIVVDPVDVEFEPKVFVELGDRLTITIRFVIARKYPTYEIIDVDITKLTFKISIFHTNGTYLGTVPDRYITIRKLPDKSIEVTIDVPPDYLRELLKGTVTIWQYYAYYPGIQGPLWGSLIVDVLTKTPPPALPEPTILPLLILVALLAILLIIKRK